MNGHPDIPTASLSTLHACWLHCVGRVRYRYGAKAPSPGCDSAKIEEIDCSGFSRWALYRATSGKLLIPDGSQMQLAWAEWAGLHRLSSYSDIGNYTLGDPSRLFIGFLRVEAGVRSVGHVWLVRQGRTMEAHGPEGAPLTGRPWNTPVLLDCEDCFELPATA